MVSMILSELNEGMTRIDNGPHSGGITVMKNSAMLVEEVFTTLPRLKDGLSRPVGSHGVAVKAKISFTHMQLGELPSPSLSQFPWFWPLSTAIFLLVSITRCVRNVFPSRTVLLGATASYNLALPLELRKLIYTFTLVREVISIVRNIERSSCVRNFYNCCSHGYRDRLRSLVYFCSTCGTSARPYCGYGYFIHPRYGQLDLRTSHANRKIYQELSLVFYSTNMFDLRNRNGRGRAAEACLAFLKDRNTHALSRIGPKKLNRRNQVHHGGGWVGSNAGAKSFKVVGQKEAIKSRLVNKSVSLIRTLKSHGI